MVRRVIKYSPSTRSDEKKKHTILATNGTGKYGERHLNKKSEAHRFTMAEREERKMYRSIHGPDGAFDSAFCRFHLLILVAFDIPMKSRVPG